MYVQEFPLTTHEEEKIVAVEKFATERNDETRKGFSSEEKIKANFEPLHAQISALTQILDRLFQGNLVREFTTISIRETRFPYESPLAYGIGNSETPPIASMTTAQYLSGRFINCASIL